MMQETIFYGRGGQGAVSAVRLLALAFSYEGKYAQSFPFFGFERRGAPVRAFLRNDQQPIIYRGQVYKADCIVVLDSRLQQVIDVGSGLKESGIAVLNTQNNPREINLGVKLSKVGTVDALAISEAVFGPAAIPITGPAMAGAFSVTTAWITLPSLMKAINKMFKGDLAKKNEQASRMAYEATRITGVSNA